MKTLIISLLFASLIDPDAITITEPAGGAPWSGVREVTWSASAQAPDDTVEVWIRLSPGEPAGKAVVADGGFALDTATYPDAAHARIRLLVLDGQGRVYGNQTGEAFSINNAGDAVPYLSIDDEALRFSPKSCRMSWISRCRPQIPKVARSPSGVTSLSLTAFLVRTRICDGAVIREPGDVTVRPSGDRRTGRRRPDGTLAV